MHPTTALRPISPRHARAATCLILGALLATGPLGAQPRAPDTRATGPAAGASSAGRPLSREQQEDICTTAPRSEWLPEDEMRLLATHRGYRIRTFKIANGSCYEIYGFDREGRIVEAYFNPVTSRLVRQNIAR